jgi:hypothetical protein
MVQGPGVLYVHFEQPEPGLSLLLEERPSGRCFVIGEVEAAAARWLGAVPEHAYRVTLRRADGTTAAVSNAVVTPRDRPAPPGEETPAWLLRALAAGLFQQAGAAGADRWEHVFDEEAEVVPGAERVLAGGTLEGALPLRRDGGSGFLSYPTSGSFLR